MHRKQSNSIGREFAGKTRRTPRHILKKNMLRLALVCVFVIVTQQSLVQLQAQKDSSIEAGNALSAVQSVQSAFQPTGSVYATFFYPWYKNPTVDGVWGNWEGNGHTPPTNWFSNFLPIPPGSFDAATGAIHPNVGLYSSRDKSVFYWQLQQMATAKLEVAISSWWGQSVSPTNDNPGQYAIQGRTDVSFRQIVTNWMNLPDNPYPNLRWSLYYEKESIANPSATEIAHDLQYINANYVNQPSYYKIGGRPVLFVYADGTDGCSMVTRWLQGRALSGVNFYLVLKLFNGYTSCSSQPDSWHQYAPASRSATHAPYSSFISPGFWKDGTSVTLPRSTTDFDSAAAAMVAANAQWKLVETWNEWGEGTSVEPGVQVQQSKGGAAILAPNGAPFQNQYIQIMARRFPALPAGTGSASTGGVTATSTPKPATSTPKPATSTPTASKVNTATTLSTTQGTTVFLILMENHNWNQIKGSASAPYINSLLSTGAHAEAYYNPSGLHPSEPNYLWLEAGTNFGVTNDNPPSSNHQSSTAHLTTELSAAGIPWKSYQEDISGTVCPLSGVAKYAPKHNPMVFFNDVTGNNNAQSANCISHVRPYTELAGDLATGNIGRYNFITPNLCDDMHDSSGCPTSNSVKNGDTWLSKAIPTLMASSAYKNGGIIMITWDEGEGGDGPIGMIVLSPNAKHGYSNTIHYTHSSTLRTLQEIFGVGPLLGDAAKATDLSDLFTNMGSSPNPTATLKPTNTATTVTGDPTTIAATSASSMTFSPVADSAIDSSHPSTNYGVSPYLRTDASPTVRTYLRFNLQGITGSITSATLRIYANSSSSSKYDVRSVSDTTWNETTIDYSNAPSMGSVADSSTGPFSANTWTEVDVTSLVKANGLVSLALTSANSTAVSFGSRESTHQPQLIVETGGAGAALVQSVNALVAVSSPTPTDTVTPMPTTPVAQSTPLVTAPESANASGMVMQAAPAGFTVVESDSSEVNAAPAWRTLTQPSGASGGSYLINNDPSSTLSLQFAGTSIGVAFVTGPSFGQFTIQVDGVTKQVVNANSGDYQFGQVTISDLPAGNHNVQVLASAGVVGIDAFLIPAAAPAEIAELPTIEPTTAETQVVEAPTNVPSPTEISTEVATPATTDEPTSLPTALPFPTVDIPGVEVSPTSETAQSTEEPASLPTALPFPTVNAPTAVNQPTLITPTQSTPLPIVTLPVTASMDDGAVDWQATGSWTLLPSAAYGSSGLGWQASAGSGDILRWNQQIDLRSVAGAQLSFEARGSGNGGSLLVQVSSDGTNWTTAAPVTPTADWQPVTVDLSAFVGKAVQLQFNWVDQTPGDVLQLDAVTVVESAPNVPTASATVTQPSGETNVTATVEAPTAAPSTQATVVQPTAVQPTAASLPTSTATNSPVPATPTDAPSPAQTAEATQSA